MSPIRSDRRRPRSLGKRGQRGGPHAVNQQSDVYGAGRQLEIQTDGCHVVSIIDAGLVRRGLIEDAHVGKIDHGPAPRTRRGQVDFIEPFTNGEFLEPGTAKVRVARDQTRALDDFQPQLDGLRLG